jgi:hypothetical protein
MATSKDLVAHLTKTQQHLAKAQKDGLYDAARELKRRANINARRDSGGDYRLSGTKRRRHTTHKGSQMKAFYRTMKHVNFDAVVVYGTPASVWSWLESGTQPHWVGAGKGSTRLSLYSRIDSGKTYAIHSARAGRHVSGTKQRVQSRFPFMNINGEYRQGPWYVAGSKPKHTFTDAVNTVDVSSIIRKAVAASVTTGMRP